MKKSRSSLEKQKQTEESTDQPSITIVFVPKH
jgi:hypothetical protein